MKDHLELRQLQDEANLWATYNARRQGWIWFQEWRDDPSCPLIRLTNPKLAIRDVYIPDDPGIDFYKIANETFQQLKEEHEAKISRENIK